MMLFLHLTVLATALSAFSTCLALSVPADLEVSSIESAANKYDTDIVLEQYRPTDEERTLYPERLWYFDQPDLFENPSYMLTNDYGTSSAYLVEASNTTYWDIQFQTYSTSVNTSASIHYMNSYSEGGCIPDSVQGQTLNTANGVCLQWQAYVVKSVFVVGEGDFQVNFYGLLSQWCQYDYIGSMRGWSGCWTTPQSGRMPMFVWPCYTC